MVVTGVVMMVVMVVVVATLAVVEEAMEVVEGGLTRWAPVMESPLEVPKGTLMDQEAEVGA